MFVRMKAMYVLAAAILAISMGVTGRAEAGPILLDGTFQNTIGTGSNLVPWSDWTNAGITRSAAPAGIPGNYAALPVGGDLFQRFNPLPFGQYTLSFSANNPSPNAAELVLAVQQELGTPPYIGIADGTLWIIDLAPQSGWLSETFYFTLNTNDFVADEFYFSNSYDAPVTGIENSVNRPGTLLDVADVSLVTGFTAPSPTPVPEPSSLSLMAAGLVICGGAAFAKRRSRTGSNSPAV